MTTSFIDLREQATALLNRTGASRVTIRMADGGAVEFPIVAEVCSPGVPALSGHPVVRRTLTNPGPLEYLETERKPLIQPDVETSPPVFPEIIAAYGVRAQMLAPILRDDALVGILSVHSTTVRGWSQDDVNALVEASAAVQEAVTNRRP
jgi:maleate isomerase